MLIAHREMSSADKGGKMQKETTTPITAAEESAMAQKKGFFTVFSNSCEEAEELFTG